MPQGHQGGIHCLSPQHAMCDRGRMRNPAAALLLLPVTSCGTSEEVISQEGEGLYVYGSPELVAPPDQTAFGPQEVHSHDDYGNAWPFTVDEGRVECSAGAVVFVVGQRRYGLNDAARRAGETAPDAIVVRDDASNEPQIGYRTIVERGLRLCE
jgi:hypothetical protein